MEFFLANLKFVFTMILLILFEKNNALKKKILYTCTIIIGAKLAGAPVVFRSRSLVVLNKSRILLNKSRILILHPHFSGPFGANDNNAQQQLQSYKIEFVHHTVPYNMNKKSLYEHMVYQN